MHKTATESIDEVRRRAFESAWIEGKPRPIDEFLPGADQPSYLATLEELVHIEIEFSWEALSKPQPDVETLVKAEDEAPRARRIEDYLEQFEALNLPAILQRLIEQEFRARKQFGDATVSVDEYRQRFPHVEAYGQSLESILAVPADEMQACAATAATAAPMPTSLGDYDILEEIGRGGMGVVYRAHQRSADRDVALKVVRRDQIDSLPPDTQSNALERFRTEAQAAARLQHDNIVTVYDVGQVDGQRYYSMRYVQGRSLAEMLRNGPIESRRAAAYMEQVARAVHAAHTAGVLHRDLKPQNVMVDREMDRALVTDFGLAKLLEGADELTRAGEVMGTPAYMSPEQARDASHVSAATDTYSLGATLYCLITGRPPFFSADPLETLRQVVDEVPVAPSRLNPDVNRDVETICLKCLEKEPAKRYGSAGAVADEFARFLRDEPILARPIGAVGRTFRWCRRNPMLAGWITAAAVCLMLAFVSAVVGYVKTSAALAESEESYRQARKTVDDFFTEVSESDLLNQPGLQPLRKDLLQRALAHYLGFLEKRRNDSSLQEELGRAYYRVAVITEQIDSPKNAQQYLRDALQIQQALTDEQPKELSFREALASTYNATGRILLKLQRLDDAEKAFTAALELRERLVAADDQQSEYGRTRANTHMNLGLVAKSRGDFDAARRQFQTAQVERTKLLASETEDRHLLRDRAMGYYNLGTLVLAIERPQIGQLQDAAANLDLAIADFDRVLAAEPEHLANRHRRAVCYRVLGNVRNSLAGQYADRAESSADEQPEQSLKSQQQAAENDQLALRSYEKARELMQPLARHNPRVVEYQTELAGILISLGDLQQQREELERAAASFEEARTILEPLADKQANVRRDLAFAMRELGIVQLQLGELEPAIANLRAAASRLGKLAREFPHNQDYRENLQITKTLLNRLHVPLKPE